MAKVKVKQNKSNGCAMNTFLVHGRFKTKKWDYNHHIVPPISSSAAYRLSSAERGALGFESFAKEGDGNELSPIYIYDRLDEPTRGMLEENLAKAELGEIAVCFATGMAAVSAALGVTVKTGDEILCHKTLYGCTHNLLTSWYPRYNIHSNFVDMKDLNSVKNSLTKKTRVVYFESPANPTLELIDISAVVEVVRAWEKTNKGKIFIIIDNTFATPFCQRPLTLGVDIVLHSLTKGIGGFGTDMGGVVITRKELWNELLMYRKDFGGAMAPKVAWPILVYGLSSLSLRIKEQQKTALVVAEFLEEHPKIGKVTYPGLDSFPQRGIAKKQMRDYNDEFAPGIMVYFTLKGDRKAGLRFLDHIADNAYAITLAVSLGQIRTLIESPVLMTHSLISTKDKKTSGLEEGGVRLSIGLEDPKDIIHDLDYALRSM